MEKPVQVNSIDDIVRKLFVLQHHMVRQRDTPQYRGPATELYYQHLRLLSQYGEKEASMFAEWIVAFDKTFTRDNNGSNKKY